MARICPREGAAASDADKGVTDMQRTHQEELSNLLFGEDRELVNLKLFPGSDRGLTGDRLCAAAHRAISAALKAGPVDNPPLTGQPKRRLVA